MNQPTLNIRWLSDRAIRVVYQKDEVDLDKIMSLFKGSCLLGQKHLQDGECVAFVGLKQG